MVLTKGCRPVTTEETFSDDVSGDCMQYVTAMTDHMYVRAIRAHTKTKMEQMSLFLALPLAVRQHLSVPYRTLRILRSLLSYLTDIQKDKLLVRYVSTLR